MIAKIARILRTINVKLVHVGPYDFTIPYVVHMGEVNREKLRELYRNALLLILPSKGPFEGFGMVAVEALACGTPVLVSTEAGVAEYLDPIFVSTLDFFQQKLMRMIELMLSNPEPLVKKALEESKKFSQENLLAAVKVIEKAASLG
jgi:glycosyltransferase involved in cell wall biosynthesis